MGLVAWLLPGFVFGPGTCSVENDISCSGSTRVFCRDMYRLSLDNEPLVGGGLWGTPVMLRPVSGT